jgi:hypothetical protein
VGEAVGLYDAVAAALTSVCYALIGNRGLTLAFSAEEGVVVQGIHSEAIVDEADLRRLLIDACENRATHTLPPGTLSHCLCSDSLSVCVCVYVSVP